jgi:type II secretory pathway pseudopilin PulG
MNEAAMITSLRPFRRAPMASRHALTLIEMLIAMALTLIMMGAVAQIFGMFGEGVSNSRNLTELTDRMRAVANRLQQDLGGITADLSQIGRPELAQGYFELIEGPNTDELAFYGAGATLDKSVPDGAPALTAYKAATGSDDRLLGDTDDIILFTTRSDAADFRGKLGPAGIRSPYAEVIWYCTRTPASVDPATFTLHRRQRIVKSHPGAGDFAMGNRRAFTTWAELHQHTDVSCHVEGGFAVPNSLGDLTKRENRFLHAPTPQVTFPYVFDTSALQTLLAEEAALGRFGDDVVLTNVIGFDVRVFDPGAPVQVPSQYATVVPGDPGYVVNSPFVETGAYVDLGYGVNGAPPHTDSNFPKPLFHDYGLAESKLRGSFTAPRTYCSWSTHYDVVEEEDTSPPYPVPLRGIEIRIRCYEPAGRQVRQITVRHTFESH